MNTPTMADLLEMLTYRRPAWTKTEKKFIGRFIDSVSGMGKDSFGNRIIRVGSPNKTMISCHTDTVHSIGGKQGIEVLRGGVVRLANPHRFKNGRNCLGADDGAGVFAALSMIAANVPALYVFHRAEEIGGLGSTFIQRYTPSLLDGIEHCIALDRRGEFDIITHQMMGMSASDEFAEALGELIGMGHSPCPYGTFTDSANYTDLVPECTNISMGYFTEHTAVESLNTDYLLTLVDRLCTIDLEELPALREVGDYGITADRWNSKNWPEQWPEEEDSTNGTVVGLDDDLPLGLSVVPNDLNCGYHHCDGHEDNPFPLDDNGKDIMEMTDEEFAAWIQR